MIKYILLLATILIMSNGKTFEEENTLIYVGDPMCSWCYGFGPEITDIKAALPSTVGFQVIMGGLRPHGTQTMAELSSFLKEHWVTIHERTGQPFTYDIFQQPDFIYDTEPACRAVVTARNMDESKALPFFKAVQTAFYANNKNTHEVKTYLEIAKQLEMDVKQFETMFSSPEIKKLTATDFEVAGQMGINSFPSLVLKKGEEYFLVGKGFAESEGIIKTIEEAMK